jgi:hypothetical protein
LTRCGNGEPRCTWVSRNRHGGHSAAGCGFADTCVIVSLRCAWPFAVCWSSRVQRSRGDFLSRPQHRLGPTAGVPRRGGWHRAPEARSVRLRRTPFPSARWRDASPWRPACSPMPQRRPAHQGSSLPGSCPASLRRSLAVPGTESGRPGARLRPARSPCLALSPEPDDDTFQLQGHGDEGCIAAGTARYHPQPGLRRVQRGGGGLRPDGRSAADPACHMLATHAGARSLSGTARRPLLFRGCEAAERAPSGSRRAPRDGRERGRDARYEPRSCPAHMPDARTPGLGLLRTEG